MLTLRLLLAAIIVVFSSQANAASVSKSQREVIVFVTDLSQGSNLERSFYDVVEFAAVTLAQTTLGPNYNKVTVIQGGNSTLSNLRNALKTAAN
jgi:hypothetical protein